MQFVVAGALIACNAGSVEGALAQVTPTSQVRPAATDERAATSPAELVQPPSVEQSPPTQIDAPQPLPPVDGLTLEALQQIALANNPAISQAAARVQALRGKWLQAGLPPNPTIGYVGSEIGDDGGAGQQGGYVGQNYITAGKLQLDRNVVAAEIARAEQQLIAIQQRVHTDVRLAYYQALLGQRRVELATEIQRVADSAADASQALYDAQEIPLAGVLQTQINQQNAAVAVRTARNARAQAWRELSAVLNTAEFAEQSLAGDIQSLPAALDWHAEQARLLASSPEVAGAMADVARARRALQRACVEPVPDISTQVSVQYDDASDSTIAGVQVGLPLPLWNRNQGGIRQAQAEVAEAARNVQRVEQNLSQRLAAAFRRYADAQALAETYASEILPRSQRTLDLVQTGYRQGETGYIELLTAQQTFSQTNLAYLEALGELWQSYALIDGLLLEGSLAVPPQ